MNDTRGNEADRIAAVKRFEEFSFERNNSLLGILQLATYIYETPVAFITLMGDTEQVFKVNRGFDVLTMPRITSFCTHTIKTNSALVVNDAIKDTRFTNNPLVVNPPNIRFYAGAPLATHDGQNIGTLCVMDTHVKEIADEKKLLLMVLAQQVTNIMELEVTQKLLLEKIEQVGVRNKALMEIANIQSHEFRGPLSTIMAIMNTIREEGYQASGEYFAMLDNVVQKLDEKIHLVVKSTEVAININS